VALVEGADLVAPRAARPARDLPAGLERRRRRPRDRRTTARRSLPVRRRPRGHAPDHLRLRAAVPLVGRRGIRRRLRVASGERYPGRSR